VEEVVSIHMTMPHSSAVYGHSSVDNH